MVASVELAIQILVGRISNRYRCSCQDLIHPFLQPIVLGFGGLERSFDR